MNQNRSQDQASWREEALDSYLVRNMVMRFQKEIILKFRMMTKTTDHLKVKGSLKCKCLALEGRHSKTSVLIPKELAKNTMEMKNQSQSNSNHHQ